MGSVEGAVPLASRNPSRTGGRHACSLVLYVVLGILALVVAHQLGASRATAQGAATVASWANAMPRKTRSRCSGPDLHSIRGDTPAGGTSPPIPGTSPVVAIDGASGSCYYAMLENGDCYQLYCGGPAGATWGFVGNILSGSAVPVQAQSWGDLKVRYR